MSEKKTSNKETDFQKILALENEFQTWFNMAASLWTAGFVGLAILWLTLYYEGKLNFFSDAWANLILTIAVIIAIFVVLGRYGVYRMNKTSNEFWADIDQLLNKIEKGDALSSLTELRHQIDEKRKSRFSSFKGSSQNDRKTSTTNIEQGKKKRDWLKTIQVAATVSIGIATILIAIFAYSIQSQNYNIQKTLYDFEPQISGFASDIWVHGYSYQTTTTIEILINSPHSGTFNLRVNRFYPDSEYLDPEKLSNNSLNLNESVRDATYPQAYKFKGNVDIIGHLYPIQNLTGIDFFRAGRLEFEIVYFDVPMNKSYPVLFNGTVKYDVPTL